MSRKRARRPQRPAPVGLADTLESLELAAPAGITAPPVPYRHWEHAVGSRIASRARPFRIDRGVLHVRVTSGAWASELQLLSSEILGQLREVGIAVDSLRFSVGRVDGLGPPPPPEREAPRPLPLPPDLAGQVARIADDALRSAVQDAAARALGAAELRTRRARHGPLKA